MTNDPKKPAPKRRSPPPPPSDERYITTGGAWHEQGLQMFIDADGKHGVLADIARAFGVSASTVTKTAKAKNWTQRLIDKKQAEIDALVQGSNSGQVRLDRLGADLPKVQVEDLDDPEVTARVRVAQRSIGLALLAKGIEALDRVEVKSASTVVKLVTHGMALLREAHRLDDRRDRLDVNVNMRTLGQILNGSSELAEHIEAVEQPKRIEAVEAEWTPTPEPVWDDVEADDEDIDDMAPDAKVEQ